MVLPKLAFQQTPIVFSMQMFLLYRGILKLEENLYMVQSDINELQKWSEEQLLQMNSSKCKYMNTSKKCSTNISYCVIHLGGTTLGEVDSFKYLGVLLHKNLTWSEHISGIRNNLLYLSFQFLSELMHSQHIFTIFSNFHIQLSELI